MVVRDWVSEPYIHKEIDNQKNILIDLEYFDEYCDMNISTTVSLEDGHYISLIILNAVQLILLKEK